MDVLVGMNRLSDASLSLTQNTTRVVMMQAPVQQNAAFLSEQYGTDVSNDFINSVTDAVLEEYLRLPRLAMRHYPAEHRAPPLRRLDFSSSWMAKSMASR